MEFRQKSKRNPIINITSLIDVVFLLLLFFVITSTFLEQPGMKLDLPKTSYTEAVRVEGYTLFILNDGTLYLNQDPVRMNALADRLQSIAPALGDRGLILKADETVRYGLVVEVMDIVKQSGIEKLVVASQPKKSQEEGSSSQTEQGGS